MPPSACSELGSREKALLLQLARNAINGAHTEVKELPRSSPLRQPRGVFVTLTTGGKLRGCIGQITSREPLLDTVAECATGAAFRDHRFPPVTAGEMDHIVLSISVLSEPTSMSVNSRRDLLAQLQPGIDGLVLREGQRQATFLPSVWEQLPQAEQFLGQLLQKAGLPADHWSAELRFSRYTSHSFTESARRTPGPAV